jgi:hypothetical protein
MSRTLTELVAELGEATRSFNRASTSSGGDAASALGQVYEVALRELHLLQHERQKWELERKQAAARDQCIVDEQARNAHIIKLNVVRPLLPFSLLFLSSFSFPWPSHSSHRGHQNSHTGATRTSSDVRQSAGNLEFGLHFVVYRFFALLAWILPTASDVALPSAMRTQGGVLFVTTRATLCRPGSYFEAMFSGRHALLQVDGAYYLDRNGRVFEGVLDFMRTGIVQPPPNVTFEQLMHELDYFLLLERGGKSDRDDEANANANGSNSFVLRRTPEVSELEVGSAVWVKEQQETLYNYPRGARSHFGSKATVSDLFFAGNSMQQIGLTFKDGFTYYFCCRDIEMEDHTLELEHMAL